MFFNVKFSLAPAIALYLLSSALWAMDLPEGKMEVEVANRVVPAHLSQEITWSIERNDDTWHFGATYVWFLLAKPTTKDDFINYVLVGLRKDNGKFAASLSYQAGTEYKDIEHIKLRLQQRPSMVLELQQIPSFYQRIIGMSYDVLSLDKEEIGKFLSVFYNREMIPDFIINHIINQIGIEDFRINTASIIKRINEQMVEDSTPVDVERIIFTELETIKNPVLRAIITWELVSELNGPETYDRNILNNLCNQINSPNLPYFKEAKMLQADLAYTDDSSTKSIREHYKVPILILLGMGNIQKDKANQNSLINRFVSNGVLNAEFPTHLAALNNLVVSPESTFELLDIIRKQELALKALQEKK